MAQFAPLIAAAGAAVGAISQSQALRGQASARKEQGRQELEDARRQVRRDVGLGAVEAGASGLLTESFTSVFESQALEDAEFLGRIRQQTEFEVDQLRQAAKNALIKGGFDTASSFVGGKASASSSELAEQQEARLNQSPGVVKQSLLPKGKSLLNKQLTLRGPRF